jgi:hypothetical protein
MGHEPLDPVQQYQAKHRLICWLICVIAGLLILAILYCVFYVL